MSNGISLYNRGTQGMNTVISGKLAKSKGGSLKYPHGDYPIEKYIQISVYDGTLADSIGALTDGVSKIHGKLQSKLGEMATAGAATLNKTIDHNTIIRSVNKAADAKATSHIAQPGDPKPSVPQVTRSYDSFNLSDTASDISNDLLDTAIGVGKGALDEALDSINSGGLGNGSVANGAAKTFVTNIYLPLPNEIQEALGHNYEEQSGWIGDVKEKSPIGGAVDAVIGAAAFVSKITGSRSVTFDRNRVSMYTDSAFRSINLSWSLVPNNKEESKAIHEIIKALKKFSSPESVSGKILLKSPHFFRLKFGNEEIDKALQFYEVVITDIGIDYSPGGGMEMHHDETPKTMSLNITFKDREPKLMEDWEKGEPAAVAPGKPSCSGGSGPSSPSASGNNVSSGSGTTTKTSGISSSSASVGGGVDASANTGRDQATKPINPTEEGWAKKISNTTLEAQEKIVEWYDEVQSGAKLPAESDYVGYNGEDYYDRNH